MAFQISLSDNQSCIAREYDNGITLEGDYEVGLKSFVTYSIPNVSQALKNNLFHLFKYDNLGNTIAGEKLDIPDGTYELQDLFALIKKWAEKFEPDLEFKINKNSLKVSMFTKNYTIYVPPSSVCKLFGFTAQIRYPPGKVWESNMIADIFAINMIKVKCNLVASNYDNLNPCDNTLYEFPLNVEVGERIVERPSAVSYYRVKTETIYTLIVRITDQTDNLIDFRGERITLNLEFRPIRR